jgi:hypothetical protein
MLTNGIICLFSVPVVNPISTNMCYGYDSESQQKELLIRYILDEPYLPQISKIYKFISGLKHIVKSHSIHYSMYYKRIHRRHVLINVKPLNIICIEMYRVKSLCILS